MFEWAYSSMPPFCVTVCECGTNWSSGNRSERRCPVPFCTKTTPLFIGRNPTSPLRNTTPHFLVFLSFTRLCLFLSAPVLSKGWILSVRFASFRAFRFRFACGLFLTWHGPALLLTKYVGETDVRRRSGRRGASTATSCLPRVKILVYMHRNSAWKASEFFTNNFPPEIYSDLHPSWPRIIDSFEWKPCCINSLSFRQAFSAI